MSHSILMRVEKLCFEYPSVRALDNVCFEVETNSITALVGPNGAGKSTLLRCLAALDTPLSGKVYLDNINVTEHAREAHRNIGYLSDFFGLYEDLTVEQCIAYHAAAHGIKKHDISIQTLRAAQRLDISDRMQQKAKELSRGLRQRLAIAQAIVHEPKLLLLDEPASGLDPEARHSLAILFRELRDQGMTLMVSSHILTELEEYSTHMLMLKAGKIISQDTIGIHNESMCDFRMVLAENYTDLASVFSNIDDVSVIQIDDKQVWLSCSTDVFKQHELLRYLIDKGLPVASFAEEKKDMHETYLSKIQEKKS